MSDCIYKTAERITCYMYGFFPVHNIKVRDKRIQKSFSGGGDAFLDQGRSHKFYHCKNQYLGKSMGGLVPRHPPLNPPMLYKYMLELYKIKRDQSMKHAYFVF